MVNNPGAGALRVGGISRVVIRLPVCQAGNGTGKCAGSGAVVRFIGTQPAQRCRPGNTPIGYRTAALIGDIPAAHDCAARVTGDGRSGYRWLCVVGSVVAEVAKPVFASFVGSIKIAVNRVGEGSR